MRAMIAEPRRVTAMNAVEIRDAVKTREPMTSHPAADASPLHSLRGWADLPRQLRELLSHPLNSDRKLATIRRWLAWHLGSRLVPGPVLVPFVNDTRLVAAPGLANVTWNYYTGFAELEQMAFVAHYLRPGELFFDIGANVGIFSILAAATSGACCFAFEPHPATAALLRFNVRVNGLGDRITIVEAALGGSQGHAHLSDVHGPMNHILPAESGAGSRPVRISTLDHEVAERGAPTLLKVDVEGYEHAVFEGGDKTLRNPRLGALVVEINRHSARYGVPRSAMFERIRAAGLVWVAYDPCSRQLHPKLGRDVDGTHIFVRGLEAAAERLRSAPKLRVADRSL
jgi:FkbM family methyltransferase